MCRITVGSKGRRWGQSVSTICFGLYNIRNGRNVGLKSVLRGIYQANMNHGDFQKTKVAEGVYTRGSLGYQVVVTTAPIPHHSGIVVF